MHGVVSCASVCCVADCPNYCCIFKYRCKSFAKYEYSKSSASTADIDMALFAAAESRIVQLLDIFRTGCVCFADPTGPPTSMKINAFTALCKNGGLMTEWTFEPKPAPSGAVPLPTALTARALSIKEIDLIFIKVCSPVLISQQGLNAVIPFFFMLVEVGDCP